MLTFRLVTLIFRLRSIIVQLPLKMRKLFFEVFELVKFIICERQGILILRDCHKVLIYVGVWVSGFVLQ